MEKINTKIIIAFAAFGASLSFLLSIFHAVSPFHLLLRILISAFILGGLSAIGQFLIFKFIPEENLNILLINNTKEDTENKKGLKIDVSDDSTINPEELYKNEDDISNKTDNNDSELSSPTIPKEDIALKEKESGVQKSIVIEEPSFQSTDFTKEAPRIVENQSNYDKPDEETISNELNRLKEKASKNSPSSIKPHISSEREVSFTVDNKKINTDPKIIAKAIRTVLN
ncbi:MAG: hypothetical protein D6707_05780, partial [Bacteroidetes bacterium]